MKKKLLLLSLLIVSLFLFTACGKDSDAVKFKKEYEALNGTTSASGKTIRTLEIDKNNPIIYKSADEIVKMIENKETFMVYFGFASCPWCRSVLPTLFKVSKDLGLNEIYYVDVTGIRDTLEVDDNGKVVTKEEGSEAYYKLLELLNDALDDYSMKDKNGNSIDAHEKRIYAPNVVGIAKGKADKMTTGISSLQNDGYMELTDEMIKETYEKFECVVKCVLDNRSAACSLDKGC